MIQVYNREKRKYEIEKVAGDKYLKWCYESPLGKSLTELFIKKKLFSKLYGFYCDSKFSKRKIPDFIKEFNIDSNYFLKRETDFESFNDFFIRELKKEARPINKEDNILISPGDGRLLAYENISIDKLIQVKGIHYNLSELIADDTIARQYEGGTCLILRLCPTDYHRFHFIDKGIPLENHFINGNYYSVNPIAIEKIPKLYCQNKREWSIFKSENFGDVLHIEVGATCVGSIIQTYKPNTKVEKGAEKGYFKFGGSTTILFLKKGKVKIDEDIIEQTNKGFECKVLMGSSIGKKIIS
ncbi:phosphatidylserine decarboxylase [Clostridium isatidis]|uniref:Phosphatidylserine decarboxylase proenzyme n=1 Tax=Clostridium isatidis TaxID=182773 RepID=A0A343J8X6_9CLOT|nr:phosphatidylserine decarboxylase [Clostridium isatidis]ASW41984.1 phosphatidylserine decarboxylase [Clostridium isatidis]NLZ33983.1 phosphatidylserine decarboxylase [Clostridiales bacterium]